MKTEAKKSMTVTGDDIVKSCRKCWSELSYGIRLDERSDGTLHCPHCKQKYVVENGFLKSF